MSTLDGLRGGFEESYRVLSTDGGFPTEEAASSYILSQNTGVRDPHRSLMLSTVSREVGINWDVSENEKVFGIAIKNFSAG